MAFSHAALWAHPLHLLTFFSLMMSFLSLWIRRTGWLWGSFLAIAVILALQAGVITPPAFIPIATLFVVHRSLKLTLKPWTRLTLIMIAIAISIGLWFHIFPGFHNWQLASGEVLSPGAVPYNFWLNFDKPFIGIFILAWSLPLINTRTQLFQVAKKAIPLSLIGIALMMLPAIAGGVVKWDPKIGALFFIWTVENLLLVAVPEEAFCRGFVQEEIFKGLGKSGVRANVGAVLLTALLFVLLHLGFVRSVPFLSLVFLAGIIYGSIYQYTKAIESSIFCHFMLNWIHFVFFSYPALAK